MTASNSARVRSAGRRTWWRRSLLPATLASLATLLLLGVALQHAIWLRPLVQHYVRSHADRRVDFDALQIGLDVAWQPRIRLRNLKIQNAPWASQSAPLIEAQRVEFTLTWASVFGARRIVVPILRIEDATIDMQRRADGLRNWRIANPADRGPGRVRLQVLDAQRTRLRLAHEALGLDLTIASTPLDTPRPLPGHPELQLTRQLAFEGTRHGQPFQGQTAASARLSFFDTDEAFALGNGWLQTEGARLAFDGIASSLFTLAMIDADLHLAGRQPGRMATVFGRAAFAGPVIATDVRAHLRKLGTDWQWTGVRALVGRSDATGRVMLKQPGQADQSPTLQAVLASQRIDLTEWRAAAGDPLVRAGTAAPTGLAALRALNADITITVATLAGALPARHDAVPLTHLQAHAVLQGGRLRLQPVAFNLFGGHVTGNAAVDASTAPAQVALDARASGLRLDALVALAGGKAGPSLAGALDAQAVLQFRGDSAAALAASTGGQVEAQLRQASLPPKLDAALALDGGAWLRALVADRDSAVPITCAEAAMQFQGGSGHSTRLSAETPHLRLAGSASVNLAQRSFRVVLTPLRKQSAWLALDKSLQWQSDGNGVQRKLIDADGAPGQAPCRGPAAQR